MKHPGHTYGGFVSAISERGVTEGTHSDPHQSGSQIPHTFVYRKDMQVVFCWEPKVPVASLQRLRWMVVEGACIIERAEARM
jgi:hypothetical protein